MNPRALHLSKKVSATLLLLWVLCLSAGSKTDLDEIRYSYFSEAIQNRSNLQYFVVVRVHNLNTGEARECCVLGCFFRAALHREWNLNYDRLSEDLVRARALLNRPRLFEFKNEDALKQLQCDSYTIAELEELNKAINFKKLAADIKTKKMWQKEFGDNEKEMRMYAHGLFNEGILTAEDITKGGILEYIER